jgi:M6 family metalloprotease-like protein
MREISFILTLSLVIFFTAFSLAQVSPKKGVLPPADFWELQQLVQSEYSNGYYANKFRERKQIREQISQGLLPESALVTDTVFALTLMGQFTDLSGFYTQQQFQAQLYDGPNATGTVTEYYSEVSYDQLYFTGDAQGWYNVLGPIQNYSPGSSSGGPKFVVELIQASDPTLNYADYIQYYDAQNKPHIGFIAVVHAGAGAEAGANNIWSHRWNFTVYSGQPITTNDVDPVSGFNVIIDGPYAIMPERSGGSNTSGELIEIGVFAHEFGHIFGLPDLYDTDGSSEGVGEWCLMASGSWGGNGSTPETPVHMSAWCKMELGWVTPINITSYQGPLSVPNAEENSVVYRMWRDGTLSNQYFLIENRQRIGFDANIHESGFLIYHVDDSQSGNQNENHYLVDVEQADGLRNLNNNQGRGDAGDPFPGSTQNTRFDFGTNPNSQDYTLQNTFVSVRNIYKDGNMMVGDFEIGPRPGVYAYGDPLIGDFGNVEINTVSDTLEWIITNFGTDDLVISDISSVVGPFIRTSNHNFNLTLQSYDSLTIKVVFAPTAVDDYNEFFSIECNDPGFTGIQLTGHCYEIAVPFTDIFYASSGVGNNGDIININRETGVGSTIGPSLYGEIRSLTVNPINNVLYGLVAGANNSEIVRINADEGESYTLFTVDIPVLSGIDFDTSGTLYTSDQDGKIFLIDQNNGNYTLVTTATHTLNAIVFHPTTNQLWGALRKTFGNYKDSVYTIDLLTGEATPIGRTGLTVMTNDLSFDESGKLYGVTGASNQEGQFFEIDQVTGTGTLIGTGVGFNHTVGVAFSINGPPIVSVDGEDSIIPDEYALKQNFPNPFNPTTKIEFSLPVAADVQLVVYNILGQQVVSLINDQRYAGNHSILWNATDSNGMKLSSGIYLYKLKATGNDGNEFQEIKKMVLLK